MAKSPYISLFQLRKCVVHDARSFSRRGSLHNYVIPTKVGASAGGTPIQRGCERDVQSETTDLPP